MRGRARLAWCRILRRDRIGATRRAQIRIAPRPLEDGMNRRQLIAGAAALAAAGALAGRARAQAPDKLVALGHKVHQQIIMGERGGDAKNLAEPWLKERSIARIEWVTY